MVKKKLTVIVIVLLLVVQSDRAHANGVLSIQKLSTGKCEVTLYFSTTRDNAAYLAHIYILQNGEERRIETRNSMSSGFTPKFTINTDNTYIVYMYVYIPGEEDYEEHLVSRLTFPSGMTCNPSSVIDDPPPSNGGGNGGGSNPPPGGGDGGDNPPGGGDNDPPYNDGVIHNIDYWFEGNYLYGYVSFDPVPGAYAYIVYKNGIFHGSVEKSTRAPVDADNYYQFKAVDSKGNVLAESPVIWVEYSEDRDITINPPGEEQPNGCTDCNKLASILECPEWDDYMGEWERTIRRAIPPPPDWDEVASIFRDKIVPRLINDLDNLLGRAPEPPSVGQLQNRLPNPQPNLDTRVDEIQPRNPFSGTLDFDLSDFDEIEIVDESRPFEFMEPLHNLDYDDPGVMVIPGDERNSMGDIKEPDEVESTIPIPEYTPPSMPDMPSDPIPVPDTGDRQVPVPINKGDPFEEKRYYKEQPSPEKP